MSAPSLQSEIKKARPFESPQQEAYLNIIRTASVLSGAFVSLFKQHGLSESTYNVLRILRGAAQTGHPEGLPCLEVADRLVTRVPDITRLVDRLITADLAERERSLDDRRVVHIRITAKGLELLARLDEPVAHLHHSQLQHLGRGELQQLSTILEKARQPY